jgi:hypothetical protein
LLHPANGPIGYRHPLLREAVSGQIPGPMRNRMDTLLTAALRVPPA